MDASNHLAILGVAEDVALIYGDTETAYRLRALAAEVRDTEGSIEELTPAPICPTCGSNVGVKPSMECHQCGFVFSA
jgi:hypothetical protein